MGIGYGKLRIVERVAMIARNGTIGQNEERRKSMSKLPMDPIQERDNFICQYCGKDCLETLDDWHGCSIDHFLPKKAGGTNDDSNRITSCHYCNQIKGQRVFKTMDEARAYIIKRRIELASDYHRVRKHMR